MLFELGSWVLDSYADLDSNAALRLQKTFGDWYSEHPLGTGLDLHWDLDYVLNVRFKFRFQAGFWSSTLHLDLDVDWHADPGCASQFCICVHMELDWGGIQIQNADSKSQAHPLSRIHTFIQNPNPYRNPESECQSNLHSRRVLV